MSSTENTHLSISIHSMIGIHIACQRVRTVWKSLLIDKYDSTYCMQASFSHARGNFFHNHDLLYKLPPYVLETI